MKITWDLCKRMMDAYKVHKDRIIIQTSSGNKVLRAVNVPKSDLEALTETTIPSTSKTVGATLIFGVREADLDKPEDDQNFTVIMAGLMMCGTKETVDPDKIFDHFDPCPEYCAQAPDTTQSDNCP